MLNSHPNSRQSKQHSASHYMLMLLAVLMSSLIIQKTALAESWVNGISDPIQIAWQNQQSDVQVKGEGRVYKILSDDLKGSRHQRFLLRMAWGQSLLIAHNIDLAPRIDQLKVGDQVAFNGEYEWNQKGGVVHWTHRDPGNRHEHGWLKYQGRLYQ